VPFQLRVVLGIVGGLCAVLLLSERAAAVLPRIVARVVPHRKLRRLAAGWPALLRALRPRRRWIVPFSLLLWLAHLFQIWLFTVALSSPIPITVCASLSAIALMVGQLPFTFAGLGARDLALVVLLGSYMPRETAAALGILIATRGLLPPLLGMPMIGPYLSSVVGEARRWRGQMEATENVSRASTPN
jgi:uncharacterized membrane protein YbhN (UPF0104 family)